MILRAAQAQEGLEGDVLRVGAPLDEQHAQGADGGAPFPEIRVKMCANLRHSVFILQLYA